MGEYFLTSIMKKFLYVFAFLFFLTSCFGSPQTQDIEQAKEELLQQTPSVSGSILSTQT
jgi:uncharacterized lipoprotein YajG